MRAQVCTKCRKKFTEDAEFCASCGAPRGKVNLRLLGAVTALCLAYMAIGIVDLAYWPKSRLLVLVLLLSVCRRSR